MPKAISTTSEKFTISAAPLSDEKLNNFRPDGTDKNKQKRPELYNENSIRLYPQQPKSSPLPSTVNVAIFATYKTHEQAIEDVCHYIENNLSDIIQLPELFFLADKHIDNQAQLESLEALSNKMIKLVSAQLRAYQYVCTSLVIEGQHQAVLINKNGLLHSQPQLHFCQRYQWTALGNMLNIITLPLEQGFIKVAMLTADDANITEMAQLASSQNVHVLLIPFDIQEACESDIHLLSIAKENRLCVVAATREKSIKPEAKVKENSTTSENHQKNKVKVKTRKITGLIANINKTYPWEDVIKRLKPSTQISPLIIKQQHGKITKAIIHPAAK